MIFDFILNPRILLKIYEGKWDAKGIRVIKDSAGKITTEKVSNVTEIKRVDEFTYSISITKKDVVGISNLLAYINKETGFLEASNPSGSMTNGNNEFYFHEYFLIHSSSINTSRGLETTTLRLRPHKKPNPPKPPKPCTSSSSSSSSSSDCHKKKQCDKKKKHH
jgi:hypothetical protein